MTLEKVLEKGRIYWHCCFHGGIYDDKNYSRLLIETKKDFQGRYSLGLEYLPYQITSGICPDCFEKVKL